MRNPNVAPRLPPILRQLLFEHLETRKVLSSIVPLATSPWQNPANMFDVNADGVVTGADVGPVIDYCNECAGGVIPAPPPYLDVDGDSLVTAHDALEVMNALELGPKAVDDWANMLPHTVVTIDVVANDTDPDGNLVPESVTIVALPESGNVSVLADGRVTYEATSGFGGVDEFRYTVRDTSGVVSNEAVVTVVCWQNPFNPLDVNADGLVTEVDAELPTKHCNECPWDEVPPPPATPPAFLDVSGDNVVSPIDSLWVIDAIAKHPTAVDDWAYTTGHSPVLFPAVANDTDPDGVIEPATVMIVSAPEAGDVEALASGEVRYTPKESFAGVDHFSYCVLDNTWVPSNDGLVTVVSWHNPGEDMDVNGDHVVAAIDALLIINHLNEYPGSADLPGSPVTPPPFLDVSGDQKVSPIDALVVVNWINGLTTLEVSGEGELVAASWALAAEDAAKVDRVVSGVGEPVVSAVNSATERELPGAETAWLAPVAWPSGVVASNRMAIFGAKTDLGAELMPLEEELLTLLAASVAEPSAFN